MLQMRNVRCWRAETICRSSTALTASVQLRKDSRDAALLPKTNIARGSRLKRRLDQGACPPARRMGEHSAETKSQRSDLLHDGLTFRRETTPHPEQPAGSWRLEGLAAKMLAAKTSRSRDR